MATACSMHSCIRWSRAASTIFAWRASWSATWGQGGGQVAAPQRLARIALQLHGHIVDCLKVHRAWPEQATLDGHAVSQDAYMEEMRRSSVWGGTNEIWASVGCLGRSPHGISGGHSGAHRGRWMPQNGDKLLCGSLHEQRPSGGAVAISGNVQG